MKDYTSNYFYDSCGLSDICDLDIKTGIGYKYETKPVCKVNSIDISEKGVTVSMEPTIKDSGDRTEFESGAVRDMRAGKGRCDLMPLEVASCFVSDCNNDILDHIALFQKYGQTSSLVDALKIFAMKAYKSDTCTMLLEVAKHYEEGAKKYGPNNWRKGLPSWCYIDSAIRHYLKWLRGDTDEPHDRAFVWNLMCCIWETDFHKEKLS